jgi:hypothetical protein
MKTIVMLILVAATASAQTAMRDAPTTDAEKIADALRAGPDFITRDATILDWPAVKAGQYRVLRQGTSEWTCLPGPPPGYKHDEPGCFDKVFFLWLKNGLAGRLASMKIGARFAMPSAGRAHFGDSPLLRVGRQEIELTREGIVGAVEGLNIRRSLRRPSLSSHARRLELQLDSSPPSVARPPGSRASSFAL